MNISYNMDPNTHPRSISFGSDLEDLDVLVSLDEVGDFDILCAQMMPVGLPLGKGNALLARVLRVNHGAMSPGEAAQKLQDMTGLRFLSPIEDERGYWGPTLRVLDRDKAFADDSWVASPHVLACEVDASNIRPYSVVCSRENQNGFRDKYGVPLYRHIIQYWKQKNLSRAERSAQTTAIRDFFRDLLRADFVEPARTALDDSWVFPVIPYDAIATKSTDQPFDKIADKISRALRPSRDYAAKGPKKLKTMRTRDEFSQRNSLSGRSTSPIISIEWDSVAFTHVERLPNDLLEDTAIGRHST